MIRILQTFIIAIIFINSGFSQTRKIDSLKIKSDEVPTEFVFSNNLECQAIQSELLYEKPYMYSFILGEILDKRFQTIEYKGKKGSILYFEFDKNAENGKGFIQSLLWGGKKPSKKHPEEIITKGNLMIILSFPLKSEIRKKLIDLINNR